MLLEKLLLEPSVGELALKVVTKQPTILELEHVFEVGGRVRHGVEVAVMWVAVGICGSDTSAHSI